MTRCGLAVMAMVVGLAWGCDEKSDTKDESEEALTGSAAGTERSSQLATRAGVLAAENIVWSQQHMAELFPARTISRGEKSSELPRYPRDLGSITMMVGEQEVSFAEFLKRNHTQAIVVVHHGAIVYERYFGAANEATRFTTWSVAKSFTSTLIGLAIGEGLIASVDDPLTAYIPELMGTAYDGVSIKQALQMSSGVQFSEVYEGDAEADIMTFMGASLLSNTAPANQTAASFPRGVGPGTKFNYNTAESQILGWLVKSVTGKDPSLYLEEKIWRKLGMSHDATWLLDKWGKDGMEMTGCCLNAALRDWARFGQLFLHDGMVGDERLLPQGWVSEATRPDAPHLIFAGQEGAVEAGYQYQWWALGDGRYSAEGVHGQFIYVDPAADLVIVKASTWPSAWTDELAAEAFTAFAAVAKALD